MSAQNTTEDVLMFNYNKLISIVIYFFNCVMDRHGMWQMLRVYGVGGKLLKAVQSFYVDSRACVRVGNDVVNGFR